ncbi:uncharacterized protein LOC112577248 isoform X2 [Pomacea canaliculata]|uniref:uncharacterized protein LOC112577248 isoform X2 n=1 Tax=Pomacea canaliculata TaxID=400727 RepID=UPI000D73F5B6|nr:uncharacterized protein LOC112577248 isoform X2 [Pomacea canaliculata]
MDPSEVVEANVSTQNLNDLQNYLVTFNKEIEVTGQSAIPVIGDADSSDPVTDMYTPGSVAQTLQSGPDATGANHFSTSFYSEQSLLDSSLGDDTSQNIHSLVNTVDGEDNDIVEQIKQEVPNVGDLDDSMAAVHAQLAGLTSAISDLTGSSQELIMTSTGDGLEAHEGKVIRIVSLGQDGSVLSLGDGSQMQIMSEDDLQGSADIKDIPVMLEPLGQSVMMTSSDQELLTSASSSSTDIMGQGSDQLINTAGTPVILNATNTLQTLAIVPSEGENGEVNYVLIMSQPDGTSKELVAQGLTLDASDVFDLKGGSDEFTEEIIEEDGTTKRILKITPKKLFHGNSSDLMCHFCAYTSPKPYLLKRHLKSHSEDRPHKCEICDRGFKTCASLTNHVNTHTGTRPHKCRQCDAAFTTSGELVRHVRYRHTFEKPHKCPDCDYASVELSKLKRHMRSHTGERPYQCPNCSYASPDTYKLKRHMRIHTGEKPYECNICHARFTQSNSLKAHKLIHSGNKPVFQCQFCPTTCGRKTDLKIHMQKLHYSEEPLTCRKCGNSFPDRYTFKMHMKTHEGEKCYKCDECDYAACSQRHLESHILTHSGEKPFECDECEHAFRQKQLLKRHKNLHHTVDYQPPPPRDKNHDCTACDKSFAHRGNLMRHMAQHTCDFSEDETPAVTSEGSREGGSLRTITADHILHGNLMQEWREGKLGNAPQVVIVHPDGRIEEVTPKLQLPPDRSVDDLLASLEGSQSKGTNSGSTRKEKDGLKSAEKGIIANISDDGSDTDDDGNREAGTQVELESDSDEDEDDGPEGLVSQQIKDVLSTEQLLNELGQARSQGEVTGLSPVLEGGGVTLYSAGADLESVIATLPLHTSCQVDNQHHHVHQHEAEVQQHQIPTIDAPEILAHLDFANKVIKQEKPEVDTDCISVPLSLPLAQVSSQGIPVSSPGDLLTMSSKHNHSQPMIVTVTGASIGNLKTSAAKTFAVVSGSSLLKATERKTRSMKRKEEVEQASPAKRTRRAVAGQRYTYV